MRRHGFTLVNLMVSLAVMAVISGIAVVALAPDDRARVVGAAQLVAADLEYAQALSLAEPDNPAVVRFDPAGDGYWIARAATPDDPLTRPSGHPYVVIFGQGTAVAFGGVDLAVVAGATENAVEFDAFGRLAEPQTAIIGVSQAGEERRLVVSSSTGFVEIVIP